jgi:hypothetical protein
MPNKTVTAVMLTADRPYMTSRAVSFFIKQTYPWLRLLVLDTGKVPYRMDTWGPHQNITYKYQDKSVLGKSTLGDLRNLANSLAGPCDYLVHWDSDDVSHPSRVERQVTALD